MTNKELAKLLGPLLTMSGRERMRPLVMGATNDVALRWEDVAKMGDLVALLINKVDELQLYDGEEWFTIELAETET